ncbi:MAG: DNA primase [Candidatus Thermoplasmatota archaeon]|nr:DNA primase [Candidatus Thermoplasmatota archaeon]MBU1940407.1 DNA primase [Candidatus Thermoplasmatota archaeon]
MVIDPSTTKYLIKAHIKADGIIEKSDVVGAIFGQTEGLLGDELDLRELQRSARVGRIEVELESKNGKSEGTITLPTSLDRVETVILAAAFESIDRVGPCKAKINVEEVEDVRVSRRKQVIERAKSLLNQVMEKSKMDGETIADNVRQAVQVEEITSYGSDHCPAGPHIEQSDAIIIVEGRRDVLNLLKYGIKNVIAVGGTNVPKTVADLTREKITTVFVDGDRGGELILRELLQVADVDFIARAPQTREVEEIPQKLIMKSLKNKIPREQFMDMFNIKLEDSSKDEENKNQKSKKEFFSKGKRKKPEEEKEDVDREDIYKQILSDISGSLKAVLLDENVKEIEKIPVRELTDEIKKGDNVFAIVFDGIITQRLLDIANNKNVKEIVGIKLGNVGKMPKSVKVLTKADFS